MSDRPDESQALMRTLEHRPGHSHLGHLQEIVAQRVRFELHHDGLDARVGTSTNRIGTPGVRKPRAEQDEVAFRKGIDAVADVTLPLAAGDPRQLDLGMSVPDERETTEGEPSPENGLALALLDGFDGGLHTAILAIFDHAGRTKR